MTDKHAYVVTRSRQISAAPEALFELIDTLKAWQRWSPWEGLDDALGREYTGPDAGVGARYAWKGNRKVGEGSMTIVASEAPGRVEIALEFLKPFKASNRVVFTIEGGDGASTVTWEMHGHRNLFMRIFGLLFSMEKMIGKDFEKGLASLKRVAEEG